MELYHFTASRLLPKIRKQGLTIGGIACFNKKAIFVGILQETFIWLTSNPKFEQPWENPNPQERRLIKYSRTDWRITINVPKQLNQNLIKWTDFKTNEIINETTYSLLSETGGIEDWWLYRGTIPKHWFIDLTINPFGTEKEINFQTSSAF